jgi:superfamily I DNA/RNA helicase
MIKLATDHESLESFYDYLSLFSNDDFNGSSKANRVSILTIHASKGLEFECVFLPRWV